MLWRSVVQLKLKIVLNLWNDNYRGFETKFGHFGNIFGWKKSFSYYLISKFLMRGMGALQQKLSAVSHIAKIFNSTTSSRKTLLIYEICVATQLLIIMIYGVWEFA